MTSNALTALSPLDGRYARRLEPLARLFSEAGLIRHRVRVEVAWFRHLAGVEAFGALPPLAPDDDAFLRQLGEDFSDADAAEVKEIEATTNHDVKAVEYWIKNRMAARPGLADKLEMVHFACTSEDINNLAYGLILRQALVEELDPVLAELDAHLADMAAQHADLAMLSRTHGQSASPTTLGKELANTVFRLRRQRRALNRIEISGKINGAVGNFNAHIAACPDLDWPTTARDFVEDLGLVWNPYTTQIEPHDMIAELSHALVRVNTILLDFARDSWAYISLGYYKQRTVEGEVGSSTMPHKVNPIDFENGEGNLGLANALLCHLAEKLPVSRWQRDLTDSTVQRSIGSAFGYCLLAWRSIQRGLDRIEPARARIAEDVEDAWEVLAEAIQTVMRVHGIEEPYEKLKQLTRGRTIGADEVREFLEQLELPAAERRRLLEMTPSGYTGNAAAMARGLGRYT
ncbi:MAG: adenylosuccinate lyase [Wenzhouxiangellaceae bacterium]|nr:adenylosuccinate lyase [Wenzhouxiangellaceae bacterium]